MAGHDLYGITGIAIMSAGPQLAMEDCSRAAKTADASDKFFMQQVLEFDPSAKNSYFSEVPALEVPQQTFPKFKSSFSTSTDLKNYKLGWVPDASLAYGISY